MFVLDTSAVEKLASAMVYLSIITGLIGSILAMFLALIPPKPTGKLTAKRRALIIGFGFFSIWLTLTALIESIYLFSLTSMAEQEVVIDASFILKFLVWLLPGLVISIPFVIRLYSLETQRAGGQFGWWT